MKFGDIEELADSGAYGGNRTLSGLTCAFLLCAIAQYTGEKWQWSDSAVEWDEIQAMTAGAENELMADVEPEGNGMELGMIMAFAGETIPAGWLECDGAQHDKGDYPDLYDALADTFHIDSYYFNLPDLTARVVVGTGEYIGGEYVVGEVGGEPWHYLTEAEMPAHKHEFLKRAVEVWGGTYAAGATQTGRPNQETTETGGGEAHENMPPFLILRWIIFAGEASE